MHTSRQLAELYAQGENISAILRGDGEGNREANIETAYDLQTGSYIATMERAAVVRDKAEYTAEIAGWISDLCDPRHILEAGVGEATTLSGVVEHLGRAALETYGFDLSWSRIAFARRWLARQQVHGVKLCTGSLFHIPFASNSIDVVYTSHSIEPNGGNEDPILRELHRVAREYLILFEPGYELAGAEARARMKSHGYCENLKGVSESLGFDVLKHEILSQYGSALNPTAVTVIRKGVDQDRPEHVLACPRHKTPLVELGGMLYSPEALSVYPVLDDIACLRIENGIAASKYPEIVAGQARTAL